MKKVLQLVCSFYPNIGGIEKVAYDFAHAMLDMNVIQKTICLSENASEGDYINRRNKTIHETVQGIDVIRCGCFAKVASQLLSVSYPFELHRIMNNFRPDIVIFHYPNPLLAVFLLKYKRRDFKLIVFWHLDITKQKILGKLFHRQTLALVNRATYIAAATPIHLEQSEYSFAFGNKKQIFPFIIDGNRLIITSEEEIEAEKVRRKYEGKVIGFFIGRHVPYKGLKLLIEASDKLDDRFHFIIAGEGPLTGELKKIAADDKKIEFVGKISDRQWRIYLKVCDIFCFPSITRNEAFGLALAEGMYFGKPAVTFSIAGSGVNYVNLDGVTGIECPNSDSSAYAQALKQLADDPDLRSKYGMNARKRIQESFSAKQFNENVVKIIAAL